ncbi:MAG: DUF1772 domain-containing protein [Aestuariivirgaceae bacterium]
MFIVLEIATVVVVAVAMALALAHALELPGKLRLSREHYLAMQPVYYPGFTYAGATEPVGLLLLLLLLFMIPAGTVKFYLTLGAFLALLAMHAAYWLLTHPVNNFWLKDFKLKGAGALFFSTGRRAKVDDRHRDWTALRDRWEYSHMLRAGFGLTSLILIVAAVAS